MKLNRARNYIYRHKGELERKTTPNVESLSTDLKLLKVMWTEREALRGTFETCRNGKKNGMKHCLSDLGTEDDNRAELCKVLSSRKA